MSLCPICLKEDIQSILTNIGITNKILICENNDCPYVENLCNKNVDNKLVLSSNKHHKRVITLEDETSDLDLNISSTDSEDEVVNSKMPVSYTKYSLLSVQRNLENMVKEVDKICIFNWFGCPLMLKFHVKVCYFLIIHLKLFDCSKHREVSELKELYYKYEYMTSKVQKRLVSLLSFKFMKYLYDKHWVFKLATLDSLDMSERILKSFDKFITSIDRSDMYRSIYNYNETCTCCDYKMTYLKESFAVRILKNNFKFRSNEFCYQSQCKKCFGITDVSIKIVRLADFLFLDCCQGTTMDFEKLNEIVLDKSFDLGLKLQAIVELKSANQKVDVPEKEPKVEEFVLKNSIKQVINYRITFRNTECWFCIDSKSGLRIDPMKDEKLSNFDVRLLIFGQSNNPSQDFRMDFSGDLYQELDRYKNRPHRGLLKYPREMIKYSTVMLRYRDFCLQKPKMTKALYGKISTKIAAKLNCHLKRKEKRLNYRRERNKEQCARRADSTGLSGDEETDCVREKEEEGLSEGESGRNQSEEESEASSIAKVMKVEGGKASQEKRKNRHPPTKSNLSIQKKPINGNSWRLTELENPFPVTSGAPVPIFTSPGNCTNDGDDVLGSLKQNFEQFFKSDLNGPFLDDLIERKRRKLEEGR